MRVACFWISPVLDVVSGVVTRTSGIIGSCGACGRGANLNGFLAGGGGGAISSASMISLTAESVSGAGFFGRGHISFTEKRRCTAESRVSGGDTVSWDTTMTPTPAAPIREGRL